MFSSPAGTEMVHFPALPSHPYGFRMGYSGISRSGFPHSEIPGSKPACGSPGLIAACHVLHRLLAPRHSPYALSSLTKCSHAHCVYVAKELPIAGYSVVKDLRLRCLRQLRRGKPARAALARTLQLPSAPPGLDGRPSGLPSRSPEGAKAGGEYRARTGDLLVANQALSQLS